MLYTFNFALIPCCTFFHVLIFSCYTFFVSHSFHVTRFFVLHFSCGAHFARCTFFMFYSFCQVSSFCTFFVLHIFRVTLFPPCTFYMLHFFASCFMLHSFHVALFSCCTILVLLFFILYTPVMLQLFSSCTFFVLQSCHIVPFFVLHCSNFFVFQVALFARVLFFILQCFTSQLLQLNNFWGALFSCRTIFCVAQFHVVPFRTLFMLNLLSFAYLFLN